MSKKIVIIGGVAGGASTAARLRRLDETSEIIMFERGSYISYANCGLPYHIGDVIKERFSLLLQTPEAMSEKYNVDVRVDSEVIRIDRENKSVEVKKAKTGETYKESYDVLVISTGSTPLKPPIEGINSPNIFTLWTVPDTDEIKSFINEKHPKNAVVIGGGFIGLEVAENLHLAGINVTVAEAMDQVMAPIDYEMARLVQDNMVLNGVNLILGDGVSKFSSENGTVTITLASGKALTADMVILSIGVRPNSQLAKDAGLQLNQRGGIVVDKYLKTSDPSIYALGDVIEVEEFINKGKAMIALAGPANKQGRICANNIYGANEEYKGTMGTSVAKVFDLTVASTGANEKTLDRMGMLEGKDYYTATISQKSHAGYYPESTELILKMVFSVDGKKIYGAQIVGEDGADKRIDTIATAIRLGGSIYDLKELELAYAPPYSSAKDPVNMLGFVAENIIKGKIKLNKWNDIEPSKPSDYTLLDIREEAELMVFEIPGAVNIPLGELRGRISELNKNDKIIIFCAVGVRSYNAARALMENGFNNVYVYPAGTNFYKSVYYDYYNQLNGMNSTALDIKNANNISEEKKTNEIKASIQVDCSGLQCPGPIMKVYEIINKINDGDIIKVSATDSGFSRDVESWCRRTGNTFIRTEKEGKSNIVYLQKGASEKKTNSFLQNSSILTSSNDGKTIIVFSGDLDKVLASFVIANGAAAMGRPVTMFFTFWGLNVLRKTEKQNIKKPFIDAMFGKMMPQGVSKLKLSKMNMGGMGTAMMRKVMKDKNIDSLEDLVKKAMDNGVKMIACTMSMDVMGITEEELIDGVEFAGVGTYLGDAEESNVNLFI
ncbi:DsrE/DsrF/DrsH-like family protein [Sedimentibacter hydroxybenzoicus DSM 7310]|uniref:DsrE/DsrF/DrsH-like family protein n=1 Tax=Sedimentibacter hydroxybenzoicus DSM 7310 TaxID=1123245 RepID=A0A974GXS8_SEDHY|nr:DsrE/DsrF/DrsH-like family protein [Sedimentibacter hydroxybenzoicus]NYB75863.1 DsrE/DsrF/DrsH-like family protein [Sedimentibacter hydroxybenzoicus DSM 7310]